MLLQSPHIVHTQENKGTESLCKLQKSQKQYYNPQVSSVLQKNTLESLGYTKIFSKTNLASVYYLVELHADKHDRTAF